VLASSATFELLSTVIVQGSSENNAKCSDDPNKQRVPKRGEVAPNKHTVEHRSASSFSSCALSSGVAVPVVVDFEEEARQVWRELKLGKDDTDVGAAAVLQEDKELEKRSHRSFPDGEEVDGGNACNSTSGGRSTAYVWYTSGSSGRPKGCVVGHGAVAAYARARNESHRIEARLTQPKGSVTSSGSRISGGSSGSSNVTNTSPHPTRRGSSGSGNVRGVGGGARIFMASAPTFDPFIGDVVSAWAAAACVCLAPRAAVRRRRRHLSSLYLFLYVLFAHFMYPPFFTQ